MLAPEDLKNLIMIVGKVSYPVVSKEAEYLRGLIGRLNGELVKHTAPTPVNDATPFPEGDPNKGIDPKEFETAPITDVNIEPPVEEK